MADVVSARVHEIPFGETETVGQPAGRIPSQSESSRAGCIGGRRRKRDDAHAISTQVEQTSRGVGDRVRADEDGGGVTQQPRAEPLPESRGRRPLERFRELPRGEVEEGRDGR